MPEYLVSRRLEIDPSAPQIQGGPAIQALRELNQQLRASWPTPQSVPAYEPKSKELAAASSDLAVEKR